MSKTATATNATANKMMTVTELYNVFTTELLKNNRIEKVNYSDAKSQPYVGLNNFSVNLKKSSYNVYMSVDNATKCIEKFKNLVAYENGCDTTKKQLRNRLIKFDDTKTLTECIKIVCA